jgi:hypothetical protein
MGPSSANNAELRRERLARIGTVEGYLALLLIVLCLVSPKVIPPALEPYDLPVGVALWGAAWLFSISGIRHGQAYGRWAAGLSLTLLSLHAITVAYLVFGGAIFGRHR